MPIQLIHHQTFSLYFLSSYPISTYFDPIQSRHNLSDPLFSLTRNQFVVYNFDLRVRPLKLNLPMVCKPLD